MFSISAVSGDKWLEDLPLNDGEFAAASDFWLELCEDENDLSVSTTGDFCDRCKYSRHRSRKRRTFSSIGQTQHKIFALSESQPIVGAHSVFDVRKAFNIKISTIIPPPRELFSTQTTW